jgi:hypothetical protein
MPKKQAPAAGKKSDPAVPQRAVMGESDLLKVITIPFGKIFLDPNNPRIARGEQPGYDDPAAIFDEGVQERLEKAVGEAYNVSELQDRIVTLGWLPIDRIIVWQHPGNRGHYIVVEGNTRTTVLRRLRREIDTMRRKLERMRGRPDALAEDVRAQERNVQQVERIIADTDELHVLTIQADTPAELESKLLHIHSVRHITPTKPWSPYGRNWFILNRYIKLHKEKYGPDADLELDDVLIRALSDVAALKPSDTRRRIQAALMFTRFKQRFEEQLPPNERFDDDDQYFFDNILQYPFTRDEFGLDKDSLKMSPEMEEVLFKWAFSKPRPSDDENKNILRTAEDIRLWNRVKRYDADNGTTDFHTRLDVDDPDNAIPIEKVEALYGSHKAQVGAVDNLTSILAEFTKLDRDRLLSQATTLKPMLKQVVAKGNEHLAELDPLEVIDLALAALNNLRGEVLLSKGAELRPLVERMVETGQQYLEMLSKPRKR